tara:strand:- start:277 stop:447 length:171 start_codon:yes stop_codon:yes gene_type:complete
MGRTNRRLKSEKRFAKNFKKKELKRNRRRELVKIFHTNLPKDELPSMEFLEDKLNE